MRSFEAIGPEASNAAFKLGVYREGEDDREKEDTPQAFYKKYHNFLVFQAIFFTHTSNKFHCSNLFKNA